MSERITRDEVAKVAELARLSLNPQELEEFTSQLGAVLETAAQLERLDLDGVEPMSQPHPQNNVWREDEIRPSLDRNEVLSMAPSASEDRFQVPPALGESQ